jgi:hypothetical protein
MSLAVLKMMLSRAMGRTPTELELTEFLSAGRELAGGRVYIPRAANDDSGLLARVNDYHSRLKYSVRKIAKLEGISKSQVHKLLSTKSALFVDKI